MVTRIAISVALVLLSVGTSDGQDAWPGDPPIILIASQIDADGNLLLVQSKTIFIQPAGPRAPGGPMLNFRAETKVPLKGVKIYNKEGNELRVETARKLLRGKDTAILASSWGEQLAPVYRALFKDDVLLFVFPREAPTWKPAR